ncbi:MAG: uracil-DNA glycosylase [Proteobacteria bacterium]|uniref:uracil-DNA glycosylase family protein n=1 Tax=Aquabacterium sp. TaxID=1872578 RepID=UPI0035C711C7|nr:uracil-DNA glycosylase [Pseudomonadota bacterium]
MRWTERQLAMLREMGVPSFWPVTPAEAGLAPAAPAVAAAPSASAAPSAAEGALAVTEGHAAAVPSAAGPAPQAARPPRGPVAAAATATASPPAAELPLLGPRPVGIDTMDWPALREAVAGCRACSLCDSRRQTVFGVGHTQARWMIVGEAPGEQEDRQGEPFVGRAGQLLDRMLAAVGLTRSEAGPEQQVYIANVLKCRPPANRNPLPQEVAQCEPFLLRQMALVQPDLIVAMGRFAVQSLLKTSEPIGKLRGRVHEVAGIPVVVTYHPAYLLRNPADKGLAWDDLCLARELQARRAQARG